MRKLAIAVAFQTIVSVHPPLTPAEAVQVLTGHPPTDRTEVHLTGLGGWKPEPQPFKIDYRIPGGRPQDGPYGSLGTYPVQAPLNCCTSYRTNTRTGQQWLDGRRVF